MIGAVIVLYNPNLDLLQKNINSIKKQVKYLILCDNSDDLIIKNDLKKKYSDLYNYIDNKGNKGIAYALNRAIEFCIQKEIKWLLTLDQDSICPNSIIKNYKKYISINKIGIICCATNYNDITLDIGKNDYEYIKQCITSASLVNVEICKKLGGYDENMFIDLVDFEYCHRLINNNYKILRTNEVILNHQLGDLKLKKMPFKYIHVGNHNSIRKYYIARNTIYLHKKDKKNMSFYKCIYKLLTLYIKTIFYENKKIEKLKKINDGIRDGIKMMPNIDNWIK